ncbi:MAG: glycoside hydrolase family 16 protein [Ketobacter sp.]|nr:MAG: glycoside hydrolase family 16 protein [Ketobacter sp.]
MSNFFATLIMLFTSLFGGETGGSQPPENGSGDDVVVEDGNTQDGGATDPAPESGDDSGESGILPGYDQLVFNDEFDGSDLDRNLWCTRYVYGGGPSLQIPDDSCQPVTGAGTLDFLNDERQRYVDYNRSGESMHVVNEGALKLRATATRTNDSYAGYESAMIRSKANFKPDSSNSYFIVARVKLPNVVGTWPAFWINSDLDANGNGAWPPEIDIFEGALNGVEDTATMLHQAGIVKGQQTASGSTEITYQSDDFDATWKNYHSDSGSLRNRWLEVGIEWKAESVCYYVNGDKTMCENYRWVSNQGSSTPNAHILVNLAIGGQWAGRYGVGEEFLEHYSAQQVAEKGLSTSFPTEMAIDYIRVYKNN